MWSEPVLLHPYSPADLLHSSQAVSLQQRRQKDLANISISGERLILTQSDMDPSNFGIDETGRVVIFDFSEIGWLPESLANYTLLCTKKFASDVAARVFGDDLDSVTASSNLASLVQVRMLLFTTGIRTLGASVL